MGLGLLTSLVDKALVYHDPGGRYALHEVLHQYAAEKLAADPVERDEQLEGHRKYYLDLLVRADRELAGAGQKQALDLLAPEAANMRSAWYRTVFIGSLDELEKLALPLMIYYQLRSLHQEGVETFRPALDRLRREQAAAPQDPQIRILFTLFLAIVGNFQLQLGIPEGRELFKSGLELAASLPAGWIKAYALILLGYGYQIYPAEMVERWHAENLEVLTRSGDGMGVALAQHAYGEFLESSLLMEPAQFAYTAALEGFTRLENCWGMALCYQSMANVAYWLGAYSEFSRLAHDALEIYSDLGALWRKMELSFTLGESLTAQGAYSQARACFQESLDFARFMGNRNSIAVNLDCLAYIENLEGRSAEAEEISRQSLAIYRQIDHAHGTGMALSNLADAFLVRGDLVQARQYYLEASSILDGLALPWGKSKCLKMLGRIDLLENQLDAADEKLGRALAISAEISRLADTLEILELRAELHTLRGETGQAMQLLICLQGNPALTAEVWQRCERLEARLIDLLGADEVAALRKQAAAASCQNGLN